MEQIGPCCLKGKAITFVKIIITFLIVNILLIFFRANSMNDAIYIIKSMFIGISNPMNYISDFKELLAIGKIGMGILLLLVILVFIYDLISLKEDPLLLVSRQNVFLRWFFYIFLMLLLILFIPKGVPSQFIYKQF